MLIRDEFEVVQPLDDVWTFFGDIPQVAACLPGANLTEEVGDDTFVGDVTIGLGPVKLDFAGQARIKERNEAAKTIVVDASGADKKGRGQAMLALAAALTPSPIGTRVAVSLDLQLSGAVAQYGRGLVSDVTAVLLGEFATSMQGRLDAISKGLDPNAVAAPKPASGLSIGLRAFRMALMRVFRRFFVPYRWAPSR